VCILGVEHGHLISYKAEARGRHKPLTFAEAMFYVNSIESCHVISWNP
jgi:hypothetical protein